MKTSQARRNLIARQSGEHRHAFAQALIGWRGSMECHFDDTAGRLARGNAALVPASAGHVYEGLSDDSELLVIDFALADPVVAALEAACGLNVGETLFQRPEIVRLDAGILPLLEFAAARLRTGPESGNALVNYQLVSLFTTQLCQLYLTGSPQPPRHARIPVAELNRLIDQRLDEPPGNAELAHALNLSESHFYYLCQRELGVTPQQYQMNRRLEHARMLLLTRRIPLTALAFEVGFADASSFSRAYKKRFRETPGNTRARGNAPAPG